jgi:putative flippase GtrA
LAAPLLDRLPVVSVTDPARALYATFRHLVHEVAKFGIVGAANLALDFGIFNGLLATVFEHKTLTAKAISTTVAAISSYFMNRHWTWRDRERTSLGRELPLFLLLSAVGLGISLACLAISHYGLDFTSKLDDNIASFGPGLVLGMLWRFWSFKRLVFTDPEGNPATPLEAAVRTTE